MTTSHQGGSSRCANRTGGVGISEYDAPGCESLQIWSAISTIECRDFGTEGEGDVLPTEVIDHKNDHVGLRRIHLFDRAGGEVEEHHCKECGNDEVPTGAVVARMVRHLHDRSLASKERKQTDSRSRR